MTHIAIENFHELLFNTEKLQELISLRDKNN